MASHVLPTWYIDVNLGWVLSVLFMVMLGFFVHVNMLSSGGQYALGYPDERRPYATSDEKPWRWSLGCSHGPSLRIELEEDARGRE